MFLSNRWLDLPEIWRVGWDCGAALNDITRNGLDGRFSFYAHFCINHNSYCISETAWGRNLTVGIGVQSAITINF